MRWIGIACLALVVGLPATALAAHGGGHDFPGLPGPAMFGICNAWAHNGNGRENGNAGNAPPFLWLQEQAEANDQTVEEYCAQFAHPGQGGGNGGGAGGAGGPPEGRGPPA